MYVEMSDMMKSEINIFIIWKNAQKYKKEILNDIEKHFEIVKFFDVNWSKKNFAKNLTRFYGTSLPAWSGKQRDIGTGVFTLIIVRDNNPVYEYRKTLHGKDYVNVNMFDSKMKYRKLVGGGSRIHCSNGEAEANHDLTLLLGYNVNDLMNNIDKFGDVYNSDLVGTKGWNSLEQLFYVLNNTCNYVVLRNYEYLPNMYKSEEHGDIDLLTDNLYNLSKISNAEKVYRGKNRVHYFIEISGKNVYFDFRHVGDNYYCEKWEKDILNNKAINNNIYVNSGDCYNYSLLYHALIQKVKIANDYEKKLLKMFGTINKDELYKKLLNYMKKMKYDFTICEDITVYYNDSYKKLEKSIKRKIYEFYHYKFKIGRK